MSVNILLKFKDGVHGIKGINWDSVRYELSNWQAAYSSRVGFWWHSGDIFSGSGNKKLCCVNWNDGKIACLSTEKSFAVKKAES